MKTVRTSYDSQADIRCPNCKQQNHVSVSEYERNFRCCSCGETFVLRFSQPSIQVRIYKLIETELEIEE
jgi:transposase-like protein